MVSENLPKSTLWFGAFASTLTTGLTAYLPRVNKKRAKALTLFKDLSLFIAALRGTSPITDDDFWFKYKGFENRYVELMHGQETDT